MCERLADLRGALQAYAAAFEPAEYGLVGARSVLAEAAVIEKAAADLKARAAGRIADLAPSRQGRRQAARDLARLSGSGLRPAEEAIETQRRLAQLPKTAAAARRGELSPAQA